MPTPVSPQFRPPRGEADADALLAIRQACAAADGYDPLSTVESLPTHAEHLGAGLQVGPLPLVLGLRRAARAHALSV